MSKKSDLNRRIENCRSPLKSTQSEPTPVLQTAPLNRSAVLTYCLRGMDSNLRCPKRGEFFAMRLKEFQSPVITSMRRPGFYWHRQKDSNPRLSVLETDALPTELYLHIHIIVDTRGLEPHSQDFQSCAYTMSAKCPLKRKQKDWFSLNLI